MTSPLQHKSVLISGASFAGLASAFWLNRLGYAVTVVELAPTLKKGGTPVDIREGVIDVVKRMGLLEQIKAISLPDRPMQFLNPDGSTIGTQQRQAEDQIQDMPEHEGQGYEVERDDLLQMLFDQVEPQTEFLFSESIATLQQSPDAVAVTFRSGVQRTFSLVLGCDGTHSAVRRMCFGPEADFSLFLQIYFSLTIVPRLLIPENTSQLFNVPGRTIMLNAYHGKTDIAFCFHADSEIAYDRRDRTQQKQIILDHFAGVGWRTPELLEEMTHFEDFYFDKVCQIRMPSWTQGRIALVGDSAYAPSPAAGMGGSMAILGAAALADALAAHPQDLARAFAQYNQTFAPTVREIQTNAIDFGLAMVMPRTEEAIQKRNAQLLAG